VSVNLTRRAVVAGACGTACVAALSACASYRSGAPAPVGAPAPAAQPVPPTVPADPSAAPGAAAGPAPLVSTSAVPVGGGVVFAEQDVVVTQPVAGEFHAFSATCTHQGCAVDEIADGTINCPCHGSEFAVEDGSVVAGPAGSPLPERAIRVEGGSILLA
jgi:Rieske Fe-S protein